MTDVQQVPGDVARALVDRLQDESPAAALGHVVLLGIVMALVWDAVPRGLLAAWAAAVLGVTLARLVLWRRARARILSPATTVAIARSTMTILGLAWGLGTAVAAPHLRLGTLMLVVVGLGGLSAGAVTTLVADPWAFRLYLCAMLGPPMAGILFASYDQREPSALLLILVFAAFMWRAHQRAYATFVAGALTQQQLRDRERQLAQSEAYHRALLDQALDVITILDADAVMRYLSPSVERVLGYQPAELIGRRAFDLIHPDDLEATLRAFTDGVATPGALRTVEYRFQHKDGSWRYLDGVGRNLLEDPLIKAVVVNARDITERRVAEQNQQTLLRELQTALAEVKTLEGWIRICANCKRVLNDEGRWEQFESYVHAHAGVDFSHGICPECARKWSEPIG